MPGFVDSHSHLVFAGDRSGEFAARMAGEAYSAGGIGTTVAATRRRATTSCDRAAARLVAEARRSGTTTIEIKSGYGLSSDHEQRQLRDRRGADRRDDVPRRPRRPGRVPPGGPTTTSPWSAARCSTAAPRTLAGSTPSARRARSRRTSAVPCSTPGAGPGSGCACTPTSSVPATASDSASSSDAPRSTTAPISPIDDVEALAGSSTVATLLPATDFSTAPAVPRCPAPARRRRHRGAGRQLQPGLELHDVDARSASPSPCATSA